MVDTSISIRSTHHIGNGLPWDFGSENRIAAGCPIHEAFRCNSRMADRCPEAAILFSHYFVQQVCETVNKVEDELLDRIY